MSTDIRRIAIPPESSRAMRLDGILSARARGIMIDIFLCLSVGAILYTFFSYEVHHSVSTRTMFLQQSAVFSDTISMAVLGAGILSLALFFFFFFLELYYRSNHVPSPVISVGATLYKASPELTRTMAHMSFSGTLAFESGAFLYAFSQTFFSDMLAMRLGFPKELLVENTKVPRTRQEEWTNILVQAAESAQKRGEDVIRIADVFNVLLAVDDIFSRFIFDTSTKKEELMGAALWVEVTLDDQARERIWWSRDHFSRIPGVGRDLGFGYTYQLNRYSRDIAFASTKLSRESRKEEILAVEQILSRSYEANVLIVGEEGSGKHTVIEGLADWIREGRAVPALEFKRIVALDTVGIVAATKAKGPLEQLLITLMNEAVRAGNIILVIDNLPNFIESCSALGVNVIEVLSPYIGGASIQVVAFADSGSFHRDLETNTKIMKVFERIRIEEPRGEKLLRMLQDALTIVEWSSRKLFTYQAVARAAELADRFIQDGAMPEKAIDLLDEAASAAGGDVFIITADHIDAVVEKRTHIPTKSATGEERDKLLHLEDLLHQRLIAQNDAITIISSALRRARSGMGSHDRPIGTFLFLGPTGVGKTETAKALAEVYFGSRDAMIRFDMSEYQGADGITKLIGSFDAREPGILSSRLRQAPFSLLLFDEFEKASKEVHNLFLQILDEGFFSDGYGKRVSARETIIIATSNAGANLIWDMVRDGKSHEDMQKELIDVIRNNAILAPELLNRFDAVVVYRPLTQVQLASVAMLMLQDLAHRLKEQEVLFEPTKELAQKIAQIGYDPVFGARPMRRAVQDRVEELIAKKILSGTLKRGDTVTLTQSEIDAL